MTDQDQKTIADSLGAMNDPEVRAILQRQLEAYTPILERLDQLVAAGDSIAIDYLKDIACYTCGLTAHLKVAFDPALALLLLQRIGHLMASHPEKWERYTEEVAPGANANRARGRSSG